MELKDISTYGSPMTSAKVRNSCTMINNVKHVRMTNAENYRAFIYVFIYSNFSHSL